MALNLLTTVARYVKPVQDRELITVYRSIPLTGDDYQTDKNGDLIQRFEVSENVESTFQTESDAALFFSDHVANTQITRRVYLYSSKDYDLSPWSGNRALSRSGDYLRRLDGTYWKVSAVSEDFAPQGWVALRAVLQVDTPPELRRFIEGVQE